MRLIIDDTKNGQPTLPIRWCLTEAERERLVAEGVRTPYVLLVAVRLQEDMYTAPQVRRLVPLDQVMAYLPLQHSGKHTVYAQIVWDSYNLMPRELRTGRVSIQNYFLAKETSSTYHRELFARGFDNLPEHYDGFEALPSTSFVVDVDSSFFAPAPPAWEQRWVNWWFETPPRDQCQYRQRRLIAYSIQPIVMTLWFVILVTTRALLVAGRFLYGMRINNWKAVLHPWNMSTSDIWGRNFDSGGSIFLTKKDDSRRSALFLMFMPLLWLFALSFTLVYQHLMQRTGQGQFVGATIATVVGVTLGLSLIRFGDWFDNYKTRRAAAREGRDIQAVVDQEAQKQARLQALRDQLEARYRLVSCPGSDVSVRADYQDLPPAQRTAYLRFQDFKAKVCRPFARG